MSNQTQAGCKQLEMCYLEVKSQVSAFKLQVKNEHDCVLSDIVELDGTIGTLLKISNTEISALSLKYNGT